jgi:hypothetical protein
MFILRAPTRLFTSPPFISASQNFAGRSRDTLYLSCHIKLEIFSKFLHLQK